MSHMLLRIMMKDTRTLGEINHTPPAGEPVSNVWDRGKRSAE